ncbi:MAG: glutamine synthetase [Labilithrix sp.]|nr:glutamine synthetase [Labilithrix sp.]MCW5810481.1 glutamine synthetase [Labilithrix sp.]
MDVAALKQKFDELGIKKVKVGGFDLDGVLRGKYVALDKFWSVLEPGFGFCDVIFGWDIADVLYDNAKVTGWHSGYPDTHAMIDASTFRVLPAELDTAAFIVDFVEKDPSAPGGHRPHPACPRALLKTVLARAKERGFTATVGVELEFWVFKETPETLQEKGFRELTPISPGMFGYSWLREEQNRAFCHAILDEMKAFDVELEALHTETGPGVYEVAIKYDEALRAADKAALFKTQLKSLASRHGLAVTFMAKWSHDLPGSSGHLHQALWNAQKKNVFYDEAGAHQLSKIARHYVGGQVDLMPELTALYSPTVNAYKRYVPGVWAPLNASWGIENRTTAIRVIPGGPSSTRIEYRQTAADINPYVAIATCLAAGLWGIENEIEPPAVAEGDASANKERRLPRTLREATDWLDESKRARDILGEAFVDHYVRTRDWEVRQYERAVTDWELRRYFESV